jgi:hypothetical protein
MKGLRIGEQLSWLGSHTPLSAPRSQEAELCVVPCAARTERGDIAYATRSQFLEACEAAIRAHRTNLESDGVVYVDLGKGGYNGRVVVTIRHNDRMAFGTDWSSSDPSRFPVRIKAAATALMHCGCEGMFEVSHDDGSLCIRAV